MGEAQMTGHEITPRVRQLLDEFQLLSDDLQREWLRGASAEALSEWEAFCSGWPTDEEIERGLLGRSESELEWMLAKALRFRSILAGMARPPLPARSSEHLSP
jgi:hypothetical protein